MGIEKLIETLEEKLKKANGIILDLLDGTKRADEIQDQTGCDEARCQEIMEYYKTLLANNGLTTPL